MWKLLELLAYISAIALCLYQFSTTVPAIRHEIYELKTEVYADGMNTLDSQDANKIMELGPWGIVFILAVKLVVDYLHKTKENERCVTKIKELEDALSDYIDEVKKKIEKGIEENSDAIDTVQTHIDRNISEMKILVDRVDQQIIHVGVKTDEMYNWHNLNDESGSKVWYIRKSLYDSIEKLTDVQRNQNDIMRNQQIILERILKDMEKT